MTRLLLSAAVLACLGQPASCQPAPTPRLVVALTVDQMIPDYLARFAPQLHGGLARITRTGVYYPRGLQDHAITETAPGHSTVLSGRSPASTGIVANNRGVPDPGSPLIGAAGAGASPSRFRGTTLADWMLAADPELKVLSVSRKDRGAILPIGRMIAPVFWFAGSTGGFTTSTWYGRELPAWVTEWNARRGVDHLAGQTWNLLLPESEYPEPDANGWERGGSGNTFPYQLPDVGPSLFGAIQLMPWMDSLTLDLALDGVRQTGMGQRDRPDLLAVSLSTTDAVGHSWGPQSREIHDQILRLDHWLGWFLDSLEATVGRGRLLVSLTADHGVQPYPESITSGPAGRVTLRDFILEIDSVLAAPDRIDFEVDFDSGLLFANVSEMRARGINTDSLSAALASRIRTMTGVRQVFTPGTLRAAPAGDAEAGRWRRLIPPDVEWLVAVALAPNYMWGTGTTSTTHGTTNLADLTVPIAFMGPGVPQRVVNTQVRTVDIGPTLAALLGIRPSQPVEGVALPDVVGRR